jgi:hypothetical protein
VIVLRSYEQFQSGISRNLRQQKFHDAFLRGYTLKLYWEKWQRFQLYGMPPLKAAAVGS